MMKMKKYKEQKMLNQFSRTEIKFLSDTICLSLTAKVVDKLGANKKLNSSSVTHICMMSLFA